MHEEDKAERKRGGQTTWNGQAWSSAMSQRAVENGEKMEGTGCEVNCGQTTVNRSEVSL